MNKIVAIIAPFVLAYIVLWFFQVNPMASLAIFVSLGIAVLVALDGLNFIKVLPNKGLFSAMPLGIIAVIAMLFSGGLAVFLGPTFAPSAMLGSLTGSTVGVTTPIVTPGAVTTASTSSCIALAREINPDNVGKAAVPLLTAYDYESNTPTSAAVDVRSYVYINGIYSDTVSTLGAAITNRANVGDVVSIYGGNNSRTGYYLEPLQDYCVTKTNEPISLRAHNMSIFNNGATYFLTGYDNTGSATLSGGTTAAEEDYDITLSADQEDVFYLKVQNLNSDSALWLAGVAVTTTNDIDDCKPHNDESALWTAAVVPKFLKNVQFQSGNTTNANITGGYESLWKLATPVMLGEFDDVKYKFMIGAGATNPATNVEFATSDNCIVAFIDGGWNKDVDNQPYFDIYAHDDGEGDVGNTGHNLTFPVGRKLTTVIEGI